MAPQFDDQRARAEYLARIHRVMDHIEQHLSEPLALEELAKVSCFSPFHFHRLFSAMTGESLYQYILRMRLERAAHYLGNAPDKNITAVALDCGFSSSATFARAFRAAFGVSASDFRKNCKTESKHRKAASALDAYSPGQVAAPHAGDAPLPTWRQTMMNNLMNLGTDKLPAQHTRVVDSAARSVAYVRHVGPYAGNAKLFGDLFGRLCSWAGPRGLIGPQSQFLTIYHDNPEITSQDKLRISVCVTVPAETRGTGDIGTMVIPAGKYAVAHFELAPPQYAAAWNWFMGEWLPSSGFAPDDRPCFEMMLNNPEEHPEHKHIVELWEPVRPL